MELTPEQLSSLDLMGIPVWEFRSEESDFSTDNKETIDSSALSEQVAQTSLIVIQSEQHNEQAQRLFHAILYAIDLMPEQVALLDVDAFSSLAIESFQDKLVLVLGKRTAETLFEEPLTLGKNCLNKNTLAVIVSYTLNELLENNALKAETWQHLKMIREVHVNG